MARALGTIGACGEGVDYDAFARDLEALFAEVQQVNSRLVVSADPTTGGGGRSSMARLGSG